MDINYFDLREAIAIRTKESELLYAPKNIVGLPPLF